jgi:hypothetical protein
LKAEGNTSTAGSGDKNNGNGTASGIWVDFDWDVSQTNQFDIFTRSSLVKIFGDNTTDGIDEASAFSFPVDAFLYTSDGIAETAPSAAQVGKIGTSTAATPFWATARRSGSAPIFALRSQTAASIRPTSSSASRTRLDGWAR